MPKHAHRLIVATAKAMAAEAVQTFLSNNKVYKNVREKFPDLTQKQLERHLVNTTYPMLLEQARATLAKMLNQPMNENLKDEIAEALILDSTLPGRSKRPGFRI